MWSFQKVKKMFGRFEKTDPTPVAIPLRFQRSKSLEEQVKELINSERFNMMMKASGKETIEEAMDFGDDEDSPWSPYEDEGPRVTKEFAQFAQAEFTKLAKKKRSSSQGKKSPEEGSEVGKAGPEGPVSAPNNTSHPGAHSTLT